MSKFYITTPIFYPNARPHIGHVFTLTLADVLARYHRGRGEEVFFLAGTDDHGLTVVRAAEKQGLSVREWADTNSEAFRKAAEKAGISFSYFIRTSDHARHWSAAQEMWRRLDAAG